MEFYEDGDLWPESYGFISYKNGFDQIRNFGSNRFEVPNGSFPVFEKCNAYGYNQSPSGEKSQIGWMRAESGNITRYDARRATMIMRRAKSPAFSKSQLLANVAISRNNVAKAQNALQKFNAETDMQQAIFEYWNYYG